MAFKIKQLTKFKNTSSISIKKITKDSQTKFNNSKKIEILFDNEKNYFKRKYKTEMLMFKHGKRMKLMIKLISR